MTLKVFLPLSVCSVEAVVATFDLNLTIKTASNFRPARNCRLQVQVVTSLLTALRQWSALMQFSKSLLANDILRPRRAIYFCSDDYRTIPHVAQVLQVTGK